MKNITKEQEKIIKDIVTERDFEKGKNFPKSNLHYIAKREYENNEEEYVFRVKSESKSYYYFLYIELQNNEIFYCNCNCEQFAKTDSCKHLASCLIHFKDELIRFKTMEDKLCISKNLLEDYLKENETISHRKEEVFLEYDLEVEKSHYYNDSVYLNAKIGTQKMYQFTKKLRAFSDAYLENKPYYFGKDFEYDPQKHYFSENNQRILSYLIQNIYSITYKGVQISSKEIPFLMPLLQKEKLKINQNLVREWKEESPFEITLRRKEKYYSLQIEKIDKSIIKLTENMEYTFKDGIVYHTSKKVLKLVNQMREKGIDELLFANEDLDTFSKSLFPLVKKELQVDEEIKEIVIESKPTAHLYFEFQNDKIIAKAKFEYDTRELEYFETTNDILRDREYENKVIAEIEKWNFQKEKGQFVLEDIDACGDFLAEGLEELTKDYMVYTSEKMKQLSIKRNNMITTTFSIGQDNIMHFDFDLGVIKEEELENILKSLKQKKKYYRLQSGDFLDLNNDNLQELDQILDDLDLDYDELLAQNGEIPRYYALYLDSIRKKGSHIIKTNNLFDEFIDNFKTYQNVNVKWNKTEQNLLRDYQKDGIKWLYTLHKCGFGGILADEMGLGKSLQTINFFEKILEEKKTCQFLIVVPTSLMYNWKNEFEKFAPNISVALVNMPKVERERIIKEENATVLITTYGLLREDIDFYEEKKFDVCVIDEAQTIKNPKAGLTRAVKKIKAQTKIALTGTPIENSIIELWSIFDFLMPGFLSSLVRFEKKYHISKEEDIDSSDSPLKRLKEQINPFILRRKKEEVAKDLPPKIENTIYIDMSEEEKKIYAAEVNQVQREMEEKISSFGFQKARFEILKLITRLRQLCISPAIRYENFDRISSKLENLIKIINEITMNGHKILIFSNFRTALDLVKKELEKNKITSYTIDGSVSSKKRMELVKQFNEDQTPIFLIMLKSGGTGLNLTSADVVIHLDLWWNPQAENQATDRTHRIGQTKTVEVIKLVTKGTIEEQILSLQQKKKKLSDELIENNSNDTAIFSKLTEDDIKGLLAYENSD